MHLNHSCEPNLGLQGQIVYVALRDIAVDEELIFDYAINDDDPNELMKCQCGAESYRNVITGWTGRSQRFRAGTMDIFPGSSREGSMLRKINTVITISLF
jgi:hypothetical protein